MERIIDKAAIESAVKAILEAIGEDPDREGLKDTPARVARMYEETLGGMALDPKDVVRVSFGENYDEIIAVRDIPFYSICEHHLVPFSGKAHIAYLPKDGRVTGLSKLVRVMEIYTRRLQLQERLTTQIGAALMETLDPQGVVVIMEAEHLCMSMRGVKKPGAQTVTSCLRGLFRRDRAARQEALDLLLK